MNVPLDAEQIRLVTQSYALVTVSSRSYSELFYHRLFLEYPFVRALFPDDVTHQIAVFAKTIDLLIDNIAQLDSVRPTLSDLAKRHVNYGVKDFQYTAVGAVLIDTLEEISGPSFTFETRQAWEALYDETAGFMIAEAYGE